MAAPRRQWMRFMHLHYVVNASVRVKRLGKVVKRFRLASHKINVPIQPMEVYSGVLLLWWKSTTLVEQAHQANRTRLGCIPSFSVCIWKSGCKIRS